jgi:hypothetical protein
MAKKEDKYQMYKGKPPFGWDRFFKWFLKMIFQVLIFSWIYYANIESIRKEYNYNPVMELLAIISWIVLTDIIVSMLVYIIKTIVLYYSKYLPSNKKSNNAGLWLWEYVIYTGLRGLCYMILLINLITIFYSNFMPEWLAFISAWVSVSIGSRLIARGGSIAINAR